MALVSGLWSGLAAPSVRVGPPRGLVVCPAVGKVALVDLVAAKTALPKTEVQAVVEAVIEAVQTTVSSGDKVTLQGFGTFEQRARAARKARNPKTGAEIDVKACKTPGFKAGKAFKDAVNGVAPAPAAAAAAPKAPKAPKPPAAPKAPKAAAPAKPAPAAKPAAAAKPEALPPAAAPKKPPSASSKASPKK